MTWFQAKPEPCDQAKLDRSDGTILYMSIYTRVQFGTTLEKILKKFLRLIYEFVSADKISM